MNATRRRVLALAFCVAANWTTGVTGLLADDIPLIDAHSQVDRLIESHENIYFLTSHANPIFISKRHHSKNMDYPWTNMFSGSSLAPAWQQLVLAHPQRFVLALDSVFNEDWGSFYVSQVRLWRKALERLPSSVANAVAHENAERLWHLPPSHVSRR